MCKDRAPGLNNLWVAREAMRGEGSWETEPPENRPKSASLTDVESGTNSRGGNKTNSVRAPASRTQLVTNDLSENL